MEDVEALVLTTEELTLLLDFVEISVKRIQSMRDDITDTDKRFDDMMAEITQSMRDLLHDQA